MSIRHRLSPFEEHSTAAMYANDAQPLARLEIWRGYGKILAFIGLGDENLNEKRL